MTENEISTIEWKILELLAKSDTPLSTRHLSKTLDRSHNYIIRVLKSLTDRELVIRLPGPGHSYNYQISKQYKITMSGTPSHYIRVVGINDLEGLLRKWSAEPWEPKIFSYASNLPIGIARLYELAADVSYGERVLEKDLDEIKESLELFRHYLEQSLRTVNGILAEKKLWDLSTLAMYLLSRGGNPDELRDLAIKVKEIHNESQ